AMGLPISIDMSSANSSLRSMSRSKARRRMFERSRVEVAAHSACAATAASRARTASSTVASAMVLITSPVAGSCTSIVAPEVDASHLPPIARPDCTRSSSSCSFCLSAIVLGLLTELVCCDCVHDDLEALAQQFVRNRECGEEADHVAIGSAGQSE